MNLVLRFNGTIFQNQPHSLYNHKSVDHLGSFQLAPFTLGGTYPSSNRKTEMFNFTSNQWNELADFPFAEF